MAEAKQDVLEMTMTVKHFLPSICLSMTLVLPLTRYLSEETLTRMRSSPTLTFSPSDRCFDAGWMVHQHASPAHKHTQTQQVIVWPKCPRKEKLHKNDLHAWKYEWVNTSAWIPATSWKSTEKRHSIDFQDKRNLFNILTFLETFMTSRTLILQIRLNAAQKRTFINKSPTSERFSLWLSSLHIKGLVTLVRMRWGIFIFVEPPRDILCLSLKKSINKVWFLIKTFG